MISNIDRHYISQRATLTPNEELLYNCVLYELHMAAKRLKVPVAHDDTLTSFEAGLLRLILNSREIE